MSAIHLKGKGGLKLEGKFLSREDGKELTGFSGKRRRVGQEKSPQGVMNCSSEKIGGKAQTPYSMPAPRVKGRTQEDWRGGEEREKKT